MKESAEAPQSESAAEAPQNEWASV